MQRDLVVTAYQSASGLVNLVNPTFAVVMGGLALGRVPYERWLRFMWPLLVVLTVIIVVAISAAPFSTRAEAECCGKQAQVGTTLEV